MAQISVESEIHEAMARLTAAEKRAARALLSNYPTLGLAPVAEFAEASGASAATVLRFVAQLGFDSYPEFQRRLRGELEERIKSPLQKANAPPRKIARGEFLPRFTAQLADNLTETATRLPVSEFEGACARLADARANCHVMGGRFTDPIAAYLAAHLRIVRPGVRKLEERNATRTDQLLDVSTGDTAVILDIRRYDEDLLRLAEKLKARRARIVLITDNWVSPVARHAKFVLPCSIDVGRAWDSSTALFAVAEALVARVTELTWPVARERIAAKERMED